MDPGDILVDLMVDETLFLLIVRVKPDLTVGVGGVKGFAERECVDRGKDDVW